MNFNPIKNQIDIVRLAFYLGAVTDGLALIPMLFPEVESLIFGNSSRGQALNSSSFQGTAVALMAGWTVLLIWGAKAPVDRRAILLFTAFPVVVGIAITLIIAVRAGVYPLDRIKYLFVHMTFIFSMFIWGYIIAGRLAKKEI